MKYYLIRFTWSLICFTLTPALAHAADYTLRFAHFFPATSGPSQDIFIKWGKAVEKESNGRIKVDMYPSSTLAKPTALYNAAVTGISDVSNAIPGYTANRFPLTQIVELPGVSQNAVNGSCILQTLYQEGWLDKEFSDSKPLFFFTHGPGHIHTTDKLVKTPQDLAGMRVRRPTIVVGSILKQMKAQPISMPAPSIYQSVQRRLIQGVTLPWEAMGSFRLNEVAKYHTEVGGLYTLSFLVLMNKNVYQSLPADLRKVIDDQSGMTWAHISGQVYDQLDVKGRQQAVEAGHEIYTVPGGNDNPEWNAYEEKAREDYLSSLEAKKLPARKVYQRAMELRETCPTS